MLKGLGGLGGLGDMAKMMKAAQEMQGKMAEMQASLDTITVDDFDTHELRAASYYDLPQHKRQPREAA